MLPPLLPMSSLQFSLSIPASPALPSSRLMHSTVEVVEHYNPSDSCTNQSGSNQQVGILGNGHAYYSHTTNNLGHHFMALLLLFSHYNRVSTSAIICWFNPWASSPTLRLDKPTSGPQSTIIMHHHRPPPFSNTQASF